MTATPDEHSDGPNDRAPVSSREKQAAAVREPIPVAVRAAIATVNSETAGLAAAPAREPIPGAVRGAIATAISEATGFAAAPVADEGRDTERAVPGAVSAAVAGAAAEWVSSSWSSS